MAVRGIAERTGVRRLTAAVRGIPIEYYDVPGDRGDLLVVHGWSHSKETWLDAAASLGVGRHLVLPDLPGFGNSGKPDTEYSLRFLTGVVRDFCRETGFRTAGSCLMGHSLGGSVCIALAAFNRPRKLLLVSPVLAPVWPARLASFFGDFMPFLFGIGRRSDFILRQFARMTVRDRARLDTLTFEDVHKPTGHSMASALRSIASLDLEEDLLRLGAETLLVYGADDRTVPASQYDFLRSRPHPRIRLHPIRGAGHLPFLEKREEFLSVCRDFFRDESLTGAENFAKIKREAGAP